MIIKIYCREVIDIFNIAICDDEPEMLEKISSSIAFFFDERGISTNCIKIHDSFKLPELLKNSKIDVIFLDIDMPHITGMEIAEMINKEKIDTIIVFVTSHDALVYDTFQYSPFAFIRKSHFDSEITGVINRIIERLYEQSSYLVFQKGQQIIRIKTNDIIYIESEGNYINIHTTKGCERHRDTLSLIEQQTSGMNLIRVHKGFIANINHIERLTGDFLIMSNGTNVPIGRNYEKAVKIKILEAFRKQV